MFKDKLLTRDYSLEEINSTIETVCYANRKNLLTNSSQQQNSPLVFKILYTPHLRTKDLKHALLENWHLITNHQLLNVIFPVSPLIAYKRGQNVKDLLVRSRYMTDENDDASDMDERLLDALLEAL